MQWSHTFIQAKPPLKLTLSTLQTNANILANSADPEETAHHELSHQDLHCLLFCYRFFTPTPISNNGCVQKQWWKSPFQKLKGARVKFTRPRTGKTIIFWMKEWSIFLFLHPNITAFSHQNNLISNLSFHQKVCFWGETNTIFIRSSHLENDVRYVSLSYKHFITYLFI